MTVPGHQTDTAENPYSVDSAHPRSTKLQGSLTESEGALTLGESQLLDEPQDSHIAARGPVTSEEALSRQPSSASLSLHQSQASTSRRAGPPVPAKPPALATFRRQATTTEGEGTTSPSPRSKVSATEEQPPRPPQPTNQSHKSAGKTTPLPPSKPQAAKGEGLAPLLPSQISTTDAKASRPPRPPPPPRASKPILKARQSPPPPPQGSQAVGGGGTAPPPFSQASATPPQDGPQAVGGGSTSSPSPSQIAATPPSHQPQAVGGGSTPSSPLSQVSGTPRPHQSQVVGGGSTASPPLSQASTIETPTPGRASTTERDTSQPQHHELTSPASWSQAPAAERNTAQSQHHESTSSALLLQDSTTERNTSQLQHHKSTSAALPLQASSTERKTSQFQHHETTSSALLLQASTTERNTSQPQHHESTSSPLLLQASTTDRNTSQLQHHESTSAGLLLQVSTTERNTSQLQHHESTSSASLLQASTAEGSTSLLQHHPSSTSVPSGRAPSNPKPAGPEPGPQPSRDTSIDFKPGDIVLLNPGLLKSGKSTFINELLPESAPDKMSVSDTSYSPCTTKVQCLTVELKDIPQEWQRDYRLILVDTPGFDNQDKSNDDIFGEILQWLETKVPKGKQRGGVLYLRDAKPPFEVADGPVLKLLGNLTDQGWCSRPAMMVTTKWDREGEGKRYKISGAQPKAKSAWEVVGEFLSSLEPKEEKKDRRTCWQKFWDCCCCCCPRRKDSRSKVPPQPKESV